MWWNARGVASHTEQLRAFVRARSIDFCGVVETHLFQHDIGSASYHWSAGTERAPHAHNSSVSGGMGALSASTIQCVQLRVNVHSFWMRLEMANCTPLFVATVYAPQAGDRSGRELMWAELRAAAAEYRQSGIVVIGGDLNGRTRANSDAQRNAAGDEITAFCDDMDLCSVNHMDCASGSFSFSSHVGQSTIDYALIAVEHASLCCSFTIEEEWVTLSDHRPILLTLNALPRAAHAPGQRFDRVRWRLEFDSERLGAAVEKSLDMYVRERNDAIAGGEQHPPAEAVDALTDVFNSCAQNAMRTGVGASDKPPRSRPAPFAFHSPRYNRLVAQCQQSGNRLSRAVRNGNAQDIAERKASHYVLLAQRKSLARELKHGVRAKVYARLERQVHAPGFWLMHGALLDPPSKRALPGVVLTGSGVLVSDPQAVLECWESTFRELFTPCDSDSVSDAAREFGKEAEQYLALPEDYVPPGGHAPLLTLDDPIGEKEVERAVGRMRHNVAPGPDGIPSCFFKRGGKAVISCSTLLFNDVLETGVWPTSWDTGHIKPLFKKGSRIDPNDYRGITLLPLHSQLLRRVLNTRLSDALESTNRLSEYQTGFRAKRGTYDHLITLNELACEGRERKSALYMAFLDVTKAYDKTWQDGLWYRMRKIGVPAKALRLWRHSYAHMQRRVIVNDALTGAFHCASGVAQGAPDSPTLYDIFVDELAADLHCAGFGVHSPCGTRVPLLMYADDVVLLSGSPQQLQRMLDAVSRFAQKWRFTYNISKSAVVVAGATTLRVKQRAREHRWLLDGQVLPVPDTYPYLGLDFGLIGNGRWTAAVTHLLHAASNRTRELLYANGNQFGLHPPLQARLWNTFCRPILEYGCALWGPECSADLSLKMESLHTRHAKRALGLPFSAPDLFARSELGLHTLASRRDLLALRVFGDIVLGDDNRLVSRVVRARLAQARLALAPESEAESESKRAAPRNNSWCSLLLSVFERHDLHQFWWEGIAMSKTRWFSRCARAVEKTRYDEWHQEITRLSFEDYALLKESPSDRAESYLSSPNRSGRHLQMLARGNRMPLNEWMCRIAKAPAHEACGPCAALHAAPAAAVSEDSSHFMCDCPAYAELRAGLFDRVREALSGEREFAPARAWFQSPATQNTDRWRWLLGGDMYLLSEAAAKRHGEKYSAAERDLHSTLCTPSIRESVSRAVQHFLMLAMRERDRVCGGLRMVLIRSAEQCAERLSVIRDDAQVSRPLAPPHPSFSSSSASSSAVLSRTRPKSRPSHESSSLAITVALLQCEGGRSAERKRYACAGALALTRYTVVRAGG